MSPFQRSSGLSTVVVVASQALAVVTVFGALSLHPAEASTCTLPTASTLDARLAAQADEGGFPAVRRFVQRTRTIYGMDLTEAVGRIDRYRDATEGCRTPVDVVLPAVSSEPS